ncbi:MAG: sulfite exporter TauE/SafE family protein [Nevskiales bacterium]
MEILGYAIAGLVVGGMVGATGVGGGSLMTPILIMVFGVHPATAVGTDLLYAAITKSFGVWLHRTRGTVNWRIVGLLAAGSLPACLVTLVILKTLGHEGIKYVLITRTLAVAIILTGLVTLFNAFLRKSASREEKTVVHWLHGRWRAPITILIGVVVGATVTLTSVGAGAIVASLLLVLYPMLRAVQIVGTDLAYAIPLTLTAGLGHLAIGNFDWGLLGSMLLGSLPGIYLGTRFGLSVPDRILRPILGGMLIFIGTLLLTK